MPIALRVSCPQQALSGNILLEPSKSISNRVLIIQSLCDEKFQINRLSKSDDTQTLIKMLGTDKDVLFSGHAGSSYRFMTARSCLGNKEIKLDASAQLRKRQIGPLVKALQALGADISYDGKEGFPPLIIRPSADLGKNNNEVTLQAGISSQYVTALLLIAPYLPNGLVLHLADDPVSVPYIRMTLEIMQWFGVEHSWESNTIKVSPGKYNPREFTVEGDWSAASYYYSMAALCDVADIQIDGLTSESLQGDAVVKEMFSQFGVETTFNDTGINLKKIKPTELPTIFKFDFSPYPDLAQTVMVTLGGLGIKGVLSGLKTLRIKETDRVAAMQTELARVKVLLEIKEDNGEITCLLFSKARWKDKGKFNTYEDHRMAMALTAFGCIKEIIIKDPDVVSKSYPGFWRDVEKIGMKVERIKI